MDPQFKRVPRACYKGQYMCVLKGRFEHSYCPASLQPICIRIVVYVLFLSLRPVLPDLRKLFTGLPVPRKHLLLSRQTLLSVGCLDLASTPMEKVAYMDWFQLSQQGICGKVTYIDTRQEFAMTQWNLVVPEETDRSVRTLLARSGDQAQDLSTYVDRAVRQAVFWDTVEGIRTRNRDLSPEEAEALADEALAEVRENPS